MKLKPFLQPKSHPFFSSLALLALRVIVGLAFMHHGWGKMQNPMAWMGPEAPVPAFLQFLAAFSEFGGGLAWILGLLTPVACFGIGSTMIVAMSLHAFVLKDPFVAMSKGGSSYELAIVYLATAFLFFMMGPGSISFDALFFKTKKK